MPLSAKAVVIQLWLDTQQLHNRCASNCGLTNRIKDTSPVADSSQCCSAGFARQQLLCQRALLSMCCIPHSAAAAAPCPPSHVSCHCNLCVWFLLQMWGPRLLPCRQCCQGRYCVCNTRAVQPLRPYTTLQPSPGGCWRGSSE
jgi:hypothetical protein